MKIGKHLKNKWEKAQFKWKHYKMKPNPNEMNDRIVIWK